MTGNNISGRYTIQKIVHTNGKDIAILKAVYPTTFNNWPNYSIEFGPFGNMVGQTSGAIAGQISSSKISTLPVTTTSTTTSTTTVRVTTTARATTTTTTTVRVTTTTKTPTTTTRATTTYKPVVKVDFNNGACNWYRNVDHAYGWELIASPGPFCVCPNPGEMYNYIGSPSGIWIAKLGEKPNGDLHTIAFEPIAEKLFNQMEQMLYGSNVVTFCTFPTTTTTTTTTTKKPTGTTTTTTTKKPTTTTTTTTTTTRAPLFELATCIYYWDCSMGHWRLLRQRHPYIGDQYIACPEINDFDCQKLALGTPCDTLSAEYLAIIGGCGENNQVWKNAPCIEDRCVTTYFNDENSHYYQTHSAKEQTIYYRGLGAYATNNICGSSEIGSNTACLSCTQYDPLYHPGWSDCQYDTDARLCWGYTFTEHYNSEAECYASYKNHPPS